jgi:twitching motility protein PilT
MMDIAELLQFAEKSGASDLHLSAGLPPMMRVDGEIRRVNIDPFDHKEIHALIYDIMNESEQHQATQKRNQFLKTLHNLYAAYHS